MTHTKARVFYFLSLIAHYVLQWHSYKIWKIERCKYWQLCCCMLSSVTSAVNCQCQPISGEYEPSNLKLIFHLVKKKTQTKPKKSSGSCVFTHYCKSQAQFSLLAVSNFFLDFGQVFWCKYSILSINLFCVSPGSFM